MERLIEKTISVLTERLADGQGTILIQQEGGAHYRATCTFYPPATEEQITQMEESVGFVLPDDYRAFLKITNGCRLFDDAQFGGEAYIYSTEQLREYNDQQAVATGYLGIASIYQDEIVICSQPAPSLYWKGMLDSCDCAVPLQMDFEHWLDRFIVCQGEKFWLW